MLLARLSGIKFAPVNPPERKSSKLEKTILPETREIKEQEKSIVKSGPLCVAAKCLSDEDIALLNKIRVLPSYAKVVDGKNGLEITLAADKNDGIHKLPDGCTMRNTETGSTIILR